MSQQLNKLTIKGFKSIQDVEAFQLNRLNILIGANGAGKSNFIALFRLLRAMGDQRLTAFVREQGGADSFFFHGPQVTGKIEIELFFGENGYRCEFTPSADERLILTEQVKLKTDWLRPESGNWESNFLNIKFKNQLPFFGFGPVIQTLSDLVVYHFHDTSNTAPMRRSEIVQDTAYLRPDAANIAPFLLHLQEKNLQAYQEIVNAVRLVTPFFDDFLLQPMQRGARETVNLSWRQVGSDYPMQPYQLSDGTIRFICLATALLQSKLPTIIVIDKPELGLHPYAIAILAELIQSAATKTQLIIATQSPTLLDHFTPEDVIIVNRQDGASIFERLNADALQLWLEEYSLGELWQKNVIAGGQPMSELSIVGEGLSS